MSTRAKQHANYKDYWETPPELFAALNQIFQFDLDCAANSQNHLCNRWMGEGGIVEDALAEDWPIERAGFVNWPYGRQSTPLWLDAVNKQAQQGKTIVVLGPANTSSGWFHRFVLEGATQHIRLLTPRVQFLLGGERLRGEGGEMRGNVGGSFIAVYGPHPQCLDHRPRIAGWRWKEDPL